jgi:hypothetical protein
MLESNLCFLVTYHLTTKGKVRHHWGSKRACHMYGSYASLSNGKQNVTCISSRRVVGMQVYKWRQQKPKWKDLKV